MTTKGVMKMPPRPATGSSRGINDFSIGRMPSRAACKSTWMNRAA